MEDVGVDYFTDEWICVTCSGEEGGECTGNGRDVEEGCAAYFPVRFGCDWLRRGERGGSWVLTLRCRIGGFL